MYIRIENRKSSHRKRISGLQHAFCSNVRRNPENLYLYACKHIQFYINGESPEHDACAYVHHKEPNVDGFFPIIIPKGNEKLDICICTVQTHICEHKPKLINSETRVSCNNG